jgi:hypothetical protein
MKRRGLILSTLGAVLFGGIALYRVGWSHGRTDAHDSAAPSIVPAAARDSLTSPAAWRYRQCQTRHWRYLMLQQ